MPPIPMSILAKTAEGVEGDVILLRLKLPTVARSSLDADQP
jgi:hypothetical protein